jgi:amino acid transporter
MSRELVTSSNFLTTAAVALLASSVFGIVAWRERRPRQGLNPSLVPTLPVMFISGVVALLALVHLVNLFGIHTGK